MFTRGSSSPLLILPSMTDEMFGELSVIAYRSIRHSSKVNESCDAAQSYQPGPYA